MKLRTSFASFVFAAVLAFRAPALRADDHFRIAVFPSLQPQVPAGTYRAFTVSETGTVVGKIPSGSFTQAASWQNGVLTPLGFYPGGFNSYATNANTAGVVAGQIYDQPGNPLAAVRSGGTWLSLLYPTGNAYGWTSATGINSSSRVVGYATSRGLLGGPGGNAFYHPGADGNTRPTILTVPSPYTWSDAFAISDTNLIAGSVYYGAGDASRSTAIIWNTTGGYSLLGPSIFDTGYYPTAAQALNNNGFAVGGAILNGNVPVAAYWSGTAGTHWITDSQGSLIPGIANAISNTNIVVGSTVASSDSSSSLAWMTVLGSGNVYSLTALQNTPGLTLYTATGINSNLQIAGISSAGGYLATPVIYRLASGAWNSASSWLWGLQPAAIHPVSLSGTSALTVTGPGSPATVSELNLGNAAGGTAATLSLAAGQTITVTGNVFGNGTTTVLPTGTLSLDGTLNSPLQLGGTLAGTGTVNGALTVVAGGSVSPGHSPGALTINGAAVFASGASLRMEINGTAAGTQYDQLTVSGNTDLGGCNLLLSGTYTPAVGETFLLVNHTGTGAVTHMFAGLPEGGLVSLNGRDLLISYASGDGNDVVLTALSAIQAFRQRYFGTILNTGNAADSADADGDGLNNVGEFAFGTDPTQGTTTALQYTGTFAGGGTITQTGLPTVRAENTAGGLDVRGLFIRRKDAASIGLTYAPQFSDNLQNWQTSTTTPTVLADNGTYELVSVPFPASASGAGRGFFRVQVTLAP